MGARIALLIAASLAAACGGRGAVSDDPLAQLFARGQRAQDASYDLAEDQDLAAVRGHYLALAAADPRRAAMRRSLAAAYRSRIDLALSDQRADAAMASYRELVTLWSPSEIETARGRAQLAKFGRQSQALLTWFSRTGGAAEAALILAVLAATDTRRAAQHEQELEEVLRFSDALATSMYGDVAERARPIDILETVVESFPARSVADRLIELYRTRQRALDALFRRGGAPNLDVIRAHGSGVLDTVTRIVALLARTNRLSSAPRAVADIVGVGDNQTLRTRLDIALAKGSAQDWALLAQEFVQVDRFDDSDDAQSTGHDDARVICELGLAHHPRSAMLHFAAAGHARRLNQVWVAQAHLEAGLALEPDHREATVWLAELYSLQISALMFGDRPRAAGAMLAKFERFYRAASKRFDEPFTPDLADAYAATGRGMISLGELDTARKYLERSIASRPTLEAFEYAGTIELKLGRHSEAASAFKRALALPVVDENMTFARAKVLRLAGEAQLGLKQPALARERFSRALVAWKGLLPKLLPAYRAEALVEIGKLRWHLGQRERALVEFDSAVDADPDGETTHTDVVAFLIVRDQYERALDAYHRALGNQDMGDYYKVYMSLWVVAEAARTKRAPDALALEYLDTRDGRLWYDALAQYARRQHDVQALVDRATTRGRRAELLYYTAVLREAPRDPARAQRLLRGVLDTDMVLFFEYDMARHWLERGF